MSGSLTRYDHRRLAAEEAMRKTITWVVVADGARARLLVNEGPGKGLDELPDGEMAAEHAPSRDIQADRPGRTFDSTGEGRHAKEPPTDPHRDAKRRFAREVAGRLDAARKRGDFDRVVLIAPPQALGDLRACLSKGVQAKVSAELAKDLTHLAVHELPDRVGAVLAV
jgi:protein required for attachment to host cells